MRGNQHFIGDITIQDYVGILPWFRTICRDALPKPNCVKTEPNYKYYEHEQLEESDP